MTPPVLYVPTAKVWDIVAPPWLCGRREEVVTRLAAHSGHSLDDDHDDQARPERAWLGPNAAGT